MFEISDAMGGYKKTVIIRGASLFVGDKEIVALLGRNGAGKTTLMKYAMGMIRSFGGEVYMDGSELPASPARRAKAGMGYVPQGKFLFPRLTVTENIVAAAVACGHNKSKTIDRIFSDFPILAERPNQLAESLSGGQQQILAIGRALATKPRVLLLDEPTEGVQPSIVDEISDILIRLNNQQGLAIFVAEQNLDFCFSIADRAYVMDQGTIKHTTSKEELLNNKELLNELLGV